ncbi:MAG: response regulator [Phycisphaerales bacterium]|nr:response regulator [Phycisphaerales bacterium]
MSRQRLDGKRILIVDDDADIRGSIGLALRSEGAVTETVEDGNAAVAAAAAADHDAIVLDMMLPRRSGFLVLEKVKLMPDPPVVIMVTANEGRRHAAYAQSLGVDAYLNKPVPLHRLVDTLVRLLEADEHDEEEED